MKSLYILAVVGLFSLALSASCINARKDPRSDCHTSTEASSFDAQPKGVPSLTKDFEPRPSVTTCIDNLKPLSKKSFIKDFEPRPSATAYVGNRKPEDDMKSREFDPRPSVVEFEGDKKSYVKGFEPRASVMKGEKNLNYVKDFKPRPSVTAYTDSTVM